MKSSFNMIVDSLITEVLLFAILQSFTKIICEVFHEVNLCDRLVFLIDEITPLGYKLMEGERSG